MSYLSPNLKLLFLRFDRLESESNNYSVTFKHIFLECRNLFHQETIPLMKYFYYPVSLWLVRDKRESTVRKTDRPARFQPTCTNWAATDMTRKDKTNLCLFPHLKYP